MTSRSPTQESRLAKKAADAADRAFFTANPGREYHSRPSIPFEGKGWTADSHIARPVMVVARPIEDRNKFDRNRVPMAGTQAGVPDHELFLSLLWNHIAVVGLAGGDVSLSSETHRQLLEAAGLWKGIRL